MDELKRSIKFNMEFLADSIDDISTELDCSNIANMAMEIFHAAKSLSILYDHRHRNP